MVRTEPGWVARKPPLQMGRTRRALFMAATRRPWKRSEHTQQKMAGRTETVPRPRRSSETRGTVAIDGDDSGKLSGQLDSGAEWEPRSCCPDILRHIASNPTTTPTMPTTIIRYRKIGSYETEAESTSPGRLVGSAVAQRGGVKKVLTYNFSSISSWAV